MIRLLLLLLALLVAPAPSAAQSGGGNIVTQVNVKVLKPLQLTSLRDLDFGTILAARGHSGPSVIQLRTADLRPEALGDLLLAAITQVAEEPERSALSKPSSMARCMSSRIQSFLANSKLNTCPSSSVDAYRC